MEKEVSRQAVATEEVAKQMLLLYVKEKGIASKSNTGVSYAQIARSIGLSPTTISLWMSGTYQGDCKKVTDAIMNYLEREKDKSRLMTHEKQFVMTTNVKKGFETARMCHLDGEIGVLYGEAGCGKTTICHEYVKLNTDAILIEADLGYSARTVFVELHQRLGLSGQGVLHDMLNECIQKLTNSGRLIIIDEAENLPHRALEMIRRVYDKAGVGILLVGLPRLLNNLRGRQHEYAQLYSRVGIATRLATLNNVDAEKIVKAFLPDIEDVWKDFYTSSKGNTRTLEKMCMRAARIAEINNSAITSQIVKKATDMLII